MIKVMFVCHGNICRSPMAEAVMKELAVRAQVADRLLVSSAGTSDEEIWNGIGNTVFPQAQAELKKQGIPCPDHRSVQLRKSDYAEYDLFLGMDRWNLENMKRIFGGDPAGKIRPLLTFAGRDADVADPWYSGKFDVAYADILAGCEGLLDYLIREGLL